MEFPDYHFIVKMDELESNKKMVEQIPNIELVDWMPQSDMLGMYVHSLHAFARLEICIFLLQMSRLPYYVRGC